MRAILRYLGVGRGEIEGEEFDGLEWCGSIVVDLGDDELELAEGDVAAVDEGVALEGVFLGEVGDVAAVDGGLVRPEIQVVAEVEQVVRCSHYYLFSDSDLENCTIRKHTQIQWKKERERERTQNRTLIVSRCNYSGLLLGLIRRLQPCSVSGLLLGLGSNLMTIAIWELLFSL